MFLVGSVGGWHHGTDRRRETVVKTDVGRRRDDDDVGGLFVLQCDDGVGRTPTAEWDCSLRGLPLVVETGGLCHDGAAAAVGGQRSNCGVGAVVHRPDHRRLHAPKNWTSVRWNAVMGTRYVYSRQAVAPYPWHLQALVVFIMIFLNLVGKSLDVLSWIEGGGPREGREWR